MRCRTWGEMELVAGREKWKAALFQPHKSQTQVEFNCLGEIVSKQVWENTWWIRGKSRSWITVLCHTDTSPPQCHSFGGNMEQKLCVEAVWDSLWLFWTGMKARSLSNLPSISTLSGFLKGFFTALSVSWAASLLLCAARYIQKQLLEVVQLS